MHVLIIEDEPLIALFIQAALEDAGVDSFDIAEDEKAAISAALAHKPGFITSDVNLKQGTGPRAIEAIHDALGDIPVLFITATPDACRPCAPPGSILSKPFTTQDITRAFERSGKN